MKNYFIGKDDFKRLVKKLAESQLVAPVEKWGIKHLEAIAAKNIDQVELSGFRSAENIKSYFFKVTDTVSRYFGEQENIPPVRSIILGARACDIEALSVMDRVFLEGEFKDVQYAANREATTVISADCTAFGKTCFCNLVKGKPFPQSGFDLNLTPLEEGFVVEVGTVKGEKLISEKEGWFRGASAVEIGKRNSLRDKINIELSEANAHFSFKADLSDVHKANLENNLWKALTKDCVECSACNFICPTCSCFMLVDQEEGDHYRRDKAWDACLKAGYARVAGGANARGMLYQRLQNRYHCKFDYSFDRLGRFTCVGCGRCIDGCAGNIDMRKIFVELAKQAPLTAKLE